jgi:uncharacterized membrane protein YbhN (UPF0104 family)
LPQNPSPAGTQTSTDPSPGPNRRWLSVVKTLLLVVGLAYVVRAAVKAIRDVRSNPADLHIGATWIVLAAVAILAAFGILIFAWRYLLVALSGRQLPFIAAARIWFVSNLSIYIPAGPGWQVVQMSVLSSEQGSGAVPAGAAAILNAAINIATGIGVAAVAGSSLLASYLGDTAWIGWVLAAVGIAAICALPALLPVAMRFAQGRLHRDVPLVTPAPRVIFIAAAANVLTWIIYGLSLQFLCIGITGHYAGSPWQFTAAFAAAYVVGYLWFIFPGGLGPREAVMTGALLAAGLASQTQASLVVVASRLVLIIVQVIPALLFLAYRRRLPNEKAAAG